MPYDIKLEAGGLNARATRWRGLITLAGVTIFAAAIVTELRLPPEQRSWHGEVFGFIPYDLRIPSGNRLFETLWSPHNPRILVPTLFGVGWSINVAGLLGLLRDGPGGRFGE